MTNDIHFVCEICQKQKHSYLMSPRENYTFDVNLGGKCERDDDYGFDEELDL